MIMLMVDMDIDQGQAMTTVAMLNLCTTEHVAILGFWFISHSMVASLGITFVNLCRLFASSSRDVENKRRPNLAKSCDQDATSKKEKK